MLQPSQQVTTQSICRSQRDNIEHLLINILGNIEVKLLVMPSNIIWKLKLSRDCQMRSHLKALITFLKLRLLTYNSLIKTKLWLTLLEQEEFILRTMTGKLLNKWMKKSIELRPRTINTLWHQLVLSLLLKLKRVYRELKLLKTETFLLWS